MILDSVLNLEDNIVYHNYEELKEELQSIHKRWPKLTKIYSLSEKTAENRELFVIQISEHVNRKRREKLKPMVKLIGNIHGNEVAGREILLFLARYLLVKYTEGVENVKQLINEVDIHILPSMNPDGFEKSTRKKCEGKCNKRNACFLEGRFNGNGKDLNRDFPTFQEVSKIKSHQHLYDGRQNETKAVMRWIEENSFVLSMGFHSGAVVVSYPFDSPTGKLVLISNSYFTINKKTSKNMQTYY